MLIAAVKWISISAVFGWPFVAFVLRGTLYENDKHDSTGGSHFFRFTAWTANLLILAILVVLQLLVIRRPELWAGAPNLHFEHIYPLCWGLIGASAFSLLGSVVAWTKGYWRVPGRIHYTLAVLNAAAFLGYLYQMGVLSQVFAQAS